MPRFYGKLYPGRLNQQELYKRRAVEEYEAVMTDLHLMGIVTKEQFEQYTHRRLTGLVKPMTPKTDPFPGLQKRYFTKEYEINGDIMPAVIADMSAPTDPALHNGDIMYTLSFNDGKPPQPEPAIPTGWIVVPWEWENDQWNLQNNSTLSPVAAEEHHYIKMNNNEVWQIHLTGSTPTDLPEWYYFDERPHDLPDEWVTIPKGIEGPGEFPIAQINLETGQYRDKPYLDNPGTGWREVIRQIEVSLPVQDVRLYNGTLPLITPQSTPPVYVVVLNTYPDPHVLMQTKSIEQYPTVADFPATGNTSKIYYALADTTQYYFWDSAQYRPLDNTNRSQAFAPAENAWVAADLADDLKPNVSRIFGFEDSIILNKTDDQVHLADQVIPIAYAHGIQFIQDMTNGLFVRINFGLFFDACTDYKYDDNTKVELQAYIRVRVAKQWP
jgi:hypothetical protein